MRFKLPFRFAALPTWGRTEQTIQVGTTEVRLHVVPNRRARRYILRLRPDGSARVTAPRGGSATAARRFAERNIPWLEKQLQALTHRKTHPAVWMVGGQVLFRGELLILERAWNGDCACVRLGSELMPMQAPDGDLRPVIERHLWRLAARELPPRVLELAAKHQLPVRRVTVRNQHSRWGSCSRRGTISLNWRLVQAPDSVRDYIIFHELAHLKEMNHSSRFWSLLDSLCPVRREAERWLKLHSSLLR